MSDGFDPIQHPYRERPGTDWCRDCGKSKLAEEHGECQDLTQPGGRLVQLTEGFWVDPAEVAFVTETHYPSPDRWVTTLYLRRSERCLSVDGVRAAAVAAAINGEQLR